MSADENPAALAPLLFDGGAGGVLLCWGPLTPECLTSSPVWCRYLHAGDIDAMESSGASRRWLEENVIPRLEEDGADAWYTDRTGVLPRQRPVVAVAARLHLGSLLECDGFLTVSGADVTHVSVPELGLDLLVDATFAEGNARASRRALGDEAQLPLALPVRYVALAAVRGLSPVGGVIHIPLSVTTGGDPSDDPTADRVAGERVAAVRDRITGRVFFATDEEGQLRSEEDLHPTLQTRLELDREILRLHEHLRRPVGGNPSGPNMTSAQISEMAIGQPLALREIMTKWGLGAVAGGASFEDHFLATNRRIAALESDRGTGSLSVADWIQLLRSTVCHAEAWAVSDALHSIEDSSNDALQRLELHVEDDSGAEASRRCACCSFVTQGVDPTEELRDVERIATQPGWLRDARG